MLKNLFFFCFVRYRLSRSSTMVCPTNILSVALYLSVTQHSVLCLPPLVYLLFVAHHLSALFCQMCLYLCCESRNAFQILVAHLSALCQTDVCHCQLQGGDC